MHKCGTTIADVRLTQSCSRILKRMTTSSYFFLILISRHSIFYNSSDVIRFQGEALCGALSRVLWEIGQCTRYVLETVQDTLIVCLPWNVNRDCE